MVPAAAAARGRCAQAVIWKVQSEAAAREGTGDDKLETEGFKLCLAWTDARDTRQVVSKLGENRVGVNTRRTVPVP